LALLVGDGKIDMIEIANETADVSPFRIVTRGQDLSDSTAWKASSAILAKINFCNHGKTSLDAKWCEEFIKDLLANASVEFGNGQTRPLAFYSALGFRSKDTWQCLILIKVPKKIRAQHLADLINTSPDVEIFPLYEMFDIDPDGLPGYIMQTMVDMAYIGHPV
jgi:hypothetical protein